MEENEKYLDEDRGSNSWLGEKLEVVGLLEMWVVDCFLLLTRGAGWGVSLGTPTTGHPFLQLILSISMSRPGDEFIFPNIADRVTIIIICSLTHHWPRRGTPATTRRPPPPLSRDPGPQMNSCDPGK